MANLTPSGVPAPFEALGLTFDDVLLQPNESDVIPLSGPDLNLGSAATSA